MPVKHAKTSAKSNGADATLVQPSDWNADHVASGAIDWSGASSFIMPASSVAKNLNNVRLADQFAGADWCAKVTAADADLGATPGEIWVNQNAGQSAGAAAPTLSSNHVLRFIQAGTYPIAVGWTIQDKTGYAIYGVPGTVISFTGTAGMVFSGSGLAQGTNGIIVEGVTFSGNGAIVNAVTFTNIHRSKLDFSARNCTGFAVVFNGSLLNTGRIRVTSNELAFTTTPSGGIFFDLTVTPTIWSNSNDFFVVIEGVAGNGIQVHKGNNITLRGSSEGNTGVGGRGVQIDAGCTNTTLLNMDLEANAVEDVLFNGNNLKLDNVVMTSTKTLHVGATGPGLGIFTTGGSLAPGAASITIDTGGSGLFFMGDFGNWAYTAAGYAKVVMDTVTQTLANKTISDTLPVKRLKANQGTALVAGDFALSSGFGTTASVGSIAGTDQAFECSITASGTGQAANPTIGLTFHDGTWTNSPIAVACRTDSAVAPTTGYWAVTSRAATTLVITFIGTPVAANVYGLSVVCMGR